MGFDLLIFDFDGTLVDTRADIANSVNDMLDYYGLPKKGVDEVTSFVGDGIKSLVERCIGDGGIALEGAISVFDRAYSTRMLEETKTYPGVYEVLERLQDRKMAVLTNKPYFFTKAIADGLGLSRYFSVIIGGDTLQNKKPSTDGVDYIIKTAGVGKINTVIIGDGKNDIMVARRAAISSIYAAYGFSTIDELGEYEPDFVIHSPIELLQVC